MAGYLIAFRERVRDFGLLEKYIETATPIAISYGAEPVVLEGPKEMVEGPDCDLVLVMKFESLAKASEYYHSPAYQEAAKLRHAAADYRVCLVEGV